MSPEGFERGRLLKTPVVVKIWRAMVMLKLLAPPPEIINKQIQNFISILFPMFTPPSLLASHWDSSFCILDCPPVPHPSRLCACAGSAPALLHCTSQHQVSSNAPCKLPPSSIGCRAHPNAIALEGSKLMIRHSWHPPIAEPN